MKRRAVPVLAAVAACLVSATARAQAPAEAGAPPADDPVARAAEHDRRAEELFAAGDYTRAIAEQRLAQELAPATSRLFNMALCEERLGNAAESIELYRRFVLADDAPPDRQAIAEERIAELERQLEAEAAANEPLPSPEPPPPAPAPPETPRAPEPSAAAGLRPSAFYTLLGLTAAASVATVALGAVTLARHEEFLDLYRGDPVSQDLQQSGQRLAVLTDVMIGVTALSAAVTLALGLVTRWHHRDTSAARHRLALVGAGLAGRF